MDRSLVYLQIYDKAAYRLHYSCRIIINNRTVCTRVYNHLGSISDLKLGNIRVMGNMFNKKKAIECFTHSVHLASFYTMVLQQMSHLCVYLQIKV